VLLQASLAWHLGRAIRNDNPSRVHQHRNRHAAAHEKRRVRVAVPNKSDELDDGRQQHAEHAAARPEDQVPQRILELARRLRRIGIGRPPEVGHATSRNAARQLRKRSTDTRVCVLGVAVDILEHAVVLAHRRVFFFFLVVTVVVVVTGHVRMAAVGVAVAAVREPAEQHSLEEHQREQRGQCDDVRFRERLGMPLLFLPRRPSRRAPPRTRRQNFRRRAAACAQGQTR
jgi:hypothetical protein